MAVYYRRYFDEAAVEKVSIEVVTDVFSRYFDVALALKELDAGFVVRTLGALYACDPDLIASEAERTAHDG